MKKIISFVLAAVLLVSAVPTALATNDYSQGTQVVYEATGSESYTITVPAQLAPGGSGTVTLSGTWADNRIVTVTADPTVTLKNSIKETDTKTLNVNFEGGISEAGSNTTSQTFTKSISVDGITDALFGTWSGKFNYNVEFDDGVVNTVVFYDVAYDLAPGSTSNYEQMKIASDGKVYVKLTTAGDTECDRAFGTYTADGQKLMWIPGDNTITISEDGYSFTVEYFTDGEVNASVTYQYTP